MRISFLLVNNKLWWAQPGAKLIKYVEKTGFSHSAVMLHTDKEQYIYHATWPKSVRESMAQFRQIHVPYKTYVFDVPVEPEAIYNFLQESVGKNYSLLQLAFIYLRRIKSAFYELSNGWILNHDKHLICSEQCARTLTYLFGVKFSSDFDSIGLRELEEKLEELKALRGVKNVSDT